jgi:hypothetical protein
MLGALLCACAASAVKQPEPENTAQSADSHAPDSSMQIADYFPAWQNTFYVYQGQGNEYASYEAYIDYAQDDRFQQRVNTGGTTVVRVLRVSKDQTVIMFSLGEAQYRQNMLDVSGAEPDMLLKAPLKTGAAWLLSDARIRTITNVDAQVETPMGFFNAIEVTTEGPYGKAIDYYAKDIGLVKTVYASEGEPVTSVLARVEKEVPMVQTVRFYYPNIEDGRLYYVDRDISFYTNDITRKVLAEAYKELPTEPLGRVFSPGTQINSLYLNQDGMVYIDLNKAFQKEMNAGAAYEAMIIQSVANTFGHYYGANRVVLTVDGKPYESGHLAFQPGEYITVSDENTAPAEILSP